MDIQPESTGELIPYQYQGVPEFNGARRDVSPTVYVDGPSGSDEPVVDAQYRFLSRQGIKIGPLLCRLGAVASGSAAGFCFLNVLNPAESVLAQTAFGRGGGTVAEFATGAFILIAGELLYLGHDLSRR